LRLALIAVSVGALLLGCEAEDERPTAAAPEVLFSECRELLDGACVLEEPQSINVWLDVPASTPLLVRVDGEPLPSTGTVAGGGVRLSINVPSGARTIEVETPDVRWVPPVTLPVDWHTVPDLSELSNAERRALAEQHSGYVKLRILDRVRFESRKPQDAAASAEQARKLGAARHLKRAVYPQVHGLIASSKDLDRAEGLLDDLASFAEKDPSVHARQLYYQGLLARRMGDLGAALEYLGEAQPLNTRLSEGTGIDATQMHIVTLADAGHRDEALALTRSTLDRIARPGYPCLSFLQTVNNVSWAHLVLASAGLEHEDPIPMLMAGLERAKDCPNPKLEASFLINLGMAELQYGEPDAALAWLALIEKMPSDYRSWAEEISARAASATRDFSNSRPLVELPRPTTDVSLQWSQAVRRAENLEAWGYDALAAEAYTEAEAVVARSFEHIGTNQSGELFLAGRRASLDGLVRALLADDRTAEAACAIRLARSRELARADRSARIEVATEEERAAWKQDAARILAAQASVTRGRASLWQVSERDRPAELAKLDEGDRASRRDLDATLRGLGLEPTARTCEDLRAPAAGEVLLVAYATEDEPQVFAVSDQGVEVAPLAELSSLRAIGAAQRLTILEVGDWLDNPLHTQPWGDAETLLDLAPVAYGLDLRPRPKTTSDRKTALVVADPRSDLPKAHEEADAVTSALRDQGWTVTEIRESAAQRNAFAQHLGEVDLVHYAGHGTRGGLAGWDSALLLASDESFGVPDVFTLQAVPQGVVLTGCETAAPSRDTVAGGMNIGRAFILSGARWVIAADTEVEDHHASRVGIAVHASSANDGPARLREALLQLRKENPEAPWQHFRVIVP